MKKLLSLVPVVLVFAAAACADLPSTTAPAARPAPRDANHQVILNQRDSVALQVAACNGEIVDMAGVAHLIVGFTKQASGSFFSADYNFRGTGATTGVSYVGTESFRDRAMVTESTSSFSTVVTVKVIGQGTVPDTFVRFTARVLVANDEVRVENSDFSASCH